MSTRALREEKKEEEFDLKNIIAPPPRVSLMPLRSSKLWLLWNPLKLLLLSVADQPIRRSRLNCACFIIIIKKEREREIFICLVWEKSKKKKKKKHFLCFCLSRLSVLSQSFLEANKKLLLLIKGETRGEERNYQKNVNKNKINRFLINNNDNSNTAKMKMSLNLFGNCPWPSGLIVFIVMSVWTPVSHGGIEKLLSSKSMFHDVTPLKAVTSHFWN